MASLLKADGSETTITPANGKCFTLQEMQQYVGGYVQPLFLPDNQLMLLDEEGKLKGKPINGRATVLGATAGTMPGDNVVGDVVVCNRNEFE